jgi:hypothetical protein
MNEEMHALVENDMWESFECPKNMKVIDNPWVLRTQLNTNGFTQRLRAQLISKGHVQKIGIDYGQNFSRVAR